MFRTMLEVAIMIGFGPGELPAAWQSDYSKAVTEATASDKPLFIVICPGASEYGRFAALGTFVSDGIERTLSSDYVRCFMDTDTPEGKELARKFDTEEGPHFVILDRSAKWQVFYESGYLSESRVSSILAKYRRIKLSASGRRIEEVAQARRPDVRLCST